MVKGGGAGIRKRRGRNKHFWQPEAPVRSHEHSATGHPSYAQPRAPLRNLDEILKYLPDFRDKINIVNDINYFKSMHLCAILQLEVQYI